MFITRQSRFRNTNPEPLLDGACMLLSAVGMAAMMFMLTYTFCIPWNASYYAVKVPILSFFVGYALQKMILLILRRSFRDTGAWESEHRYFDIRPAAIPLILAGISAFRSIRPFMESIRRMHTQGLLTDKEALGMLPTSLALALFLCAAAGIAVSFYPFSRLMSQKSLLCWLAVGFFCNLLMRGDIRIGIAFGIYAFCAVFCMNQFQITQISRGFTVTKLTTAARSVSARIVLLVLALTALGTVCGYQLLRWLYQLVTALIVWILYRFFQRAPSASERIVPAFFGSGGGMLRAADNEGAPLLLFVLVCIIVMVISLLIVFRKGMLDPLREWFAALMRLLLGDGGMEPDAPTVNFVDEVITLEKVKISRTEAALRQYERMTEQDFHRELSLLRTDEERLTFAYLVMVRLLSRRYENLRDSDTPREVEAVLSQKIPGLHSVTAEIERMKYTDASADAEKMVEAIACVCRVVEDILK